MNQRPRLGPILRTERAYERELLVLSRRFSYEIARGIRQDVRGLSVSYKRSRVDAVNFGDMDALLGRLRARFIQFARSSIVYDLLDQFGRRLSRANGETLEEIIPIPPPTGAHAEVLAAFRTNNVDLIASIADQQIDQVQDLVNIAARSGLRNEVLKQQILERFRVSESRAQLIARDQILKTNSDLSRVRHEASGITAYRWSTSNDERVREMHRDLDGQIFTWDEPPVTNGQGDRNPPGRDYQCRCVAIPILPGGSVL